MVYASTQDSKGFLWFATLSGVYRYDTHSFKVFVHNPKDSTSLASNYATGVFCDSGGRIWICTDAGLTLYNSSRESFHTFKPNPNGGDAISSSDVNCVIEDMQKNIWIGTNAGLDRVNVKGKKTTFTHFLGAGSGKQPFKVKAITMGKNQELWLGTTDGLVLFDRGKIKQFKAAPDSRLPFINDFTYIHNDGLGHIWLGIRKGGLIKFNIATETFELMADIKTWEGYWPELSGFASDTRGKIWVATMSGLAHLDVITNEVEWYLKDPSNEQGMADDVLMSIFKDRQGCLWLGSYYGGLDYWDTSAPAFSRSPLDNNRLTNRTFTSSWMGMTPDNKLWLLAPDKSKITFYNKVSKRKTVFDLRLDFAFKFNHFFVDEHGVLWCGGEGNLFAYDIQKGTKKAYPIPNLGRVSAEKNIIYTILQDKEQRLWLGGPAGLLSFNKSTFRFKNWYDKEFIGSIFEDSGGRIWFAGNSKAVGVIKNDLEAPEMLVSSKNQLPEGGSVWRFAQDTKGRIWMASSKGLKCYDVLNKEFRGVDTTFKALCEGIGDVQADRMGYLWINNGVDLIRFHPDKSTIQSYNYLDGLPRKANLTIRGSQKDETGRIYINTNQEMFSFDPDRVFTNRLEEPIVLSALRLFNKPVKTGDETGILKQDVSQQPALVFAHDQNIFSLDFALLSFARSHGNMYRYRMEGFDKEWNETSVPSATYMNLPPGDYTFVVKAANGDGIWTKRPLKVKVTVLPPWWKTWYAYLFYLLTVGSAAYAINRFFWIRTSFRKENALNKVKLDFFTNVSHEIRTHLSLISGPLQKARQQLKDGQNAENNLNYAQESSDRLMLLVNELLDFRKVQSGGLRLQVIEHNVIKTVKAVVAAFEHVSREKSINTMLLCPETPVMLWFDIAQMQKVFYNLLSNAYKFTPDGGKITVSITETVNEVHVAVEDTGKGMSAADVQKLFTYYYQADSDKPGYGIGLALSKSIVEQHHGQFTVTSREATKFIPGGTVLTIHMLRENRHFSPEQIATKDNEYVGNILAENVAVPVIDSSRHSGQRNSILIIEDNDQLRFFIRELFAGEYETLEAENGLRGLTLANEHIPDIILSDVMMPEMNGIELCKRLKSNDTTSHIPVVLLTARTQNEQIIEGLSTGADDYLAKPFDPRILELKIQNLIRVRDDMKTRYRQTVVEEEDTETSIARDLNEAFISKLRALVIENISDASFGVDQLALQVGMSLSVLYRKMRLLTGMTINEFVKTIRLNKAKKLLEIGVYQVNEVATMVGFEDSKYFSKEFRKAFGKTPVEVKRQKAD